MCGPLSAVLSTIRNELVSHMTCLGLNKLSSALLGACQHSRPFGAHDQDRHDYILIVGHILAVFTWMAGCLAIASS